MISVTANGLHLAVDGSIVLMIFAVEMVFMHVEVASVTFTWLATHSNSKYSPPPFHFLFLNNSQINTVEPVNRIAAPRRMLHLI